MVQYHYIYWDLLFWLLSLGLYLTCCVHTPMLICNNLSVRLSWNFIRLFLFYGVVSVLFSLIYQLSLIYCSQFCQYASSSLGSYLLWAQENWSPLLYQLNYHFYYWCIYFLLFCVKYYILSFFTFNDSLFTISHVDILDKFIVYFTFSI